MKPRENGETNRVLILFKHKGWYLCDFYEAGSTYFDGGYTKNIIFSSPKERIFKHIYRGTAKRFFLAVDDEMDIFQALHKTRLDAAVVKETIESWENPQNALGGFKPQFDREVKRIISIADFDNKIRSVYYRDFELPSSVVHLVPSPTYNSMKAG